MTDLFDLPRKPTQRQLLAQRKRTLRKEYERARKQHRPSKALWQMLSDTVHASMRLSLGR